MTIAPMAGSAAPDLLCTLTAAERRITEIRRGADGRRAKRPAIGRLGAARDQPAGIIGAVVLILLKDFEGLVRRREYRDGRTNRLHGAPGKQSDTCEAQDRLRDHARQDKL